MPNYEGRYAHLRKHSQIPLLPSSPIEARVGSTVRTFKASNIRLSKSMVTQAPITNFKPIASYSYIKSVQPTILVPGCPTLYKSFPAPLIVTRDTGLELVDKASALLPLAPLLPLFEAIRFVDPHHDFQQYDIVTERGALKKLLSWIMGDQKTEFRIDLETTSTAGLILRRWESASFRLAEGENVGIYGPAPHYRTNFELSTCFPVKGNEDAFSHVRVFSYNLVGLHLLVQGEVDGFVLEPEFQAIASGICVDTPKESAADLTEELFERASKGRRKIVTEIPTTLHVQPYDGFQIGHENLIELKTRSIRSARPLGESDVYAQAVWSGTPMTINALHDRGEFQVEKVYKLSEMKKMEETKDVREGVKRVGALLRRIIDTLKDKPSGSRYCLISRGPDEEELLLREGGRGAGLTENKAS
ncbi:hypothetical protein P389DRAFT_207831 [Cystobasidium minutum MCA 4210]|uniref:uncharacterized protein n=1 Tax=Cystobasidium minutum MCA 4210 TaxID=1397322 RepID=UPI0034D000D7|eukprot:jgi/Rhomi1/207831/estExt_Genemark1.C_1_t20303